MKLSRSTECTNTRSKQKTIAWLVQAMVMLASTAAIAEEPYWYAGASAGETRAKIDDEKIIANLLRGGFTTTSITDDNRDTGYKIFGGYQFNRYFGLEAGYADLGKFGFNARTVPLGALSGNIKLQGANLDLVGTLPLTERFSAFARVGAFYGRARDEFNGSGLVSVLNRTPSKTETNLKAGVGLQYAFTKAVAMRLEGERYRVNDAVGGRGDIDMVSLGLVYRWQTAQPPPPMPERMPEPAPYVAPPPPPVPVVAPPPPPPAPAVERRQSQFTFSADALFEFDRFQIGPTGAAHLDTFAGQLRGLTYDAITVNGHADRIGSPTYNQTLSLKRADAVKAYLVNSAGIAPEKIRVEGHGEKMPLTRPSDCAGQKATKALIVCLQPDRRVVVDVSGLK